MREIIDKLFEIPIRARDRANIICAAKGIKGGRINLPDGYSIFLELENEIFPEFGLHSDSRPTRSGWHIFFTLYHEDLNSDYLFSFGRKGIAARGEFFRYPKSCIKKFLKICYNPIKPNFQIQALYYPHIYHLACSLKCVESQGIDLRIKRAVKSELGDTRYVAFLLDRLVNDIKLPTEKVQHILHNQGFEGKLKCEREIYSDGEGIYRRDKWRFGRIVYEAAIDFTGRCIYDEVREERKLPKLRPTKRIKTLA